MIVQIPSPLRSYTSEQSKVDAVGQTVNDILADLDRQHPGIKFRMIDEQGCIRQHIRLFVNSDQVEDLAMGVSSGDTLHVICALSGG
jgi:molybdopterin synthase sulfur carrier subunit